MKEDETVTGKEIEIAIQVIGNETFQRFGSGFTIFIIET